MFRSLLVANRGEIAVRIFRTARRLGISCLAVHSEADATSLHVALADHALCIGPAPASESYLRIDRIVEAARLLGAEAIHPGYGFLAENPRLPEACAEAGVVFVGPSAAAIRAMGDKAAAKARMAAAGVPLVPGYHGEDQDDAVLAAEALRIGFPLVIKACAGGGGRGMRVVERAEAFADALAAARREAAAAFGDDRVLLERHLARPRHVEVQILADTHGTVLALSSRDCSIQRRHQKIIEEAPAPSLPDAIRSGLAEAAVAAARAVGYVNAGTVEFIVEDERFHFLEMNTRMQVEHPVTEAITGLDLVEWQLRIAAGEKLPFASSPPVRGHAVEARLCAEDPLEGWRPATGQLLHFAVPLVEGIRVDSGVRAGDAVTPFYDPMLAKIIAHGETRAEAIARLRAALDHTIVEGVATNLDALRAILAHPGFTEGVPTTGFLAQHEGALLSPPPPAPTEAILAAAAAVLEAQRRSAWPEGPGHRGPWDRLEGWRLFGSVRRTLRLREGSRTIPLAIAQSGHVWAITLEGDTHCVEAYEAEGEGDLRVRVGDRQFRTRSLVLPGSVAVSLPGAGRWRFAIVDALSPPEGDAAGDDRVASPIPGRVAAVLCSLGDVVSRGQTLVVIEAMKTELRINAPVEGRVVRIDVAPGDQVEEGAGLVQLAASSEAATGAVRE